MSVLRKGLRACRAEDGAALITVLLIVAVMSTLAVVAFERLGFSIDRATAHKLYQRAEGQALGAEQIALVAAEKLNDLPAGRQTRREVAYPFDGGTVAGAIEDASNCFNVNSLVSSADSVRYLRNETVAAEYIRLLQVLGFSENEAEQLEGTLADWLDSDSQTGPYGAEDYDYARLNPPYRAGNGPLSDISELRLVKGYAPAVLDMLRAHLCAESETAETRLNVNSLKAEDAPLLVALIGPQLTLANASRLIAARPGGGYASQSDFWRQPPLEKLNVSQAVRSRMILKPHRYRSHIAVRYQDVQLFVTSEIEMKEDGTALLAARRVGPWK